MGNEELDNETLSEIGHYIINKDFDKIALDDFKKIEEKIRGNRNIISILTANIKPILLILLIIEILITIILSNSISTLFIGILPFFNIFFIGFFLFSIYEYSNHRKEHMFFSLFSPIVVMIATLIYQNGLFFLNKDTIRVSIVIFVYFLYVTFIFMFFTATADKLINYFFSRLNNVAFNQKNTNTFKLEGEVNTKLIYNYIFSVLKQFFNLRFFDSEKSDNHESYIYEFPYSDTKEPPVYEKLIRYYLFIYIDTSKSIITFAYFKKYFDKLLIDDLAIKKNGFLEYYLNNICKELKKTTLDNFDDMNICFQKFDKLLGKRHSTKMDKIKWLFDTKVLITLIIAIVLLTMYNYNVFSGISNWIILHETLSSAIIGGSIAVIGTVIVQFLKSSK